MTGRALATCLLVALASARGLAQPGAAALTAARADTPAAAASPTPSPAPAAPRPRRARAPRPEGPPDLYYLLDGDRVSGQTLSKGARAFVVLTPYGRLTLPRAAVQRVARADGTEEVLAAPVVVPPAETVAVPSTWTLTLVLSGKTFWQAWEPRTPGLRPDLRFALWLDDQQLASYEDQHLDPDDLPGATVNSFSFDPAQVGMSVVPGVIAEAPDVRPGRISLRLVLPAMAHDTHNLRVAYQGVGSAPPTESGAAVWQDLTATSVTFPRATGVRVEIAQQSGRMEFSGFRHKRMKNVASFQLVAHVSPPDAVHLDSPQPRP